MKTPKKPTINPPLPVEAPKPQVVDKPLDINALQQAVNDLQQYRADRTTLRVGIDENYRSDLGDFLLKAEEQFLQTLKNKVAALIREATRIA